MLTEVALGGGRLTAGVVRIGDTVRRPRSPFTGTLLSHLAGESFDGVPRYLGVDELGRDILTFLPGDVPAKWRTFTEDQVAAAGRLLRDFHEAGRGLAVRGGAVICHHDPGPNNTVFRDGRPVAFIDFDFMAEGEALEDVAYMAWSWCISSKPARGDAARQSCQVRVLADAYGLSSAQRRHLMDAVDERLVRNERFWATRVDDRSAEIVAWTADERAFVTRALAVFEAALS